MILVPSYGIHQTESGMRFLLQEEGVQHTLGPEVNIQAKMRAMKRLHYACEHRIDLKNTSNRKLPYHPLVRAFLPIPKSVEEGLIFLPDEPVTTDILRVLQRLISPTATARGQLLIHRPSEALFSMSNLPMICVRGFTFQTATRFNTIMRAAEYAPRRVIIVLPHFLAKGQQGYIDPADLDLERLSKLPLEAIGASAATRYLSYQNPEKGLWAT